MSRPPKGSRLALGLMSGTSVDGIDVALVRIAPPIRKKITQNALHARLENFVTVPFPSAVRAEVLRIAEGTRVSPGEISQLNFRLGRAFGEAALRACRKFRVDPRRLSVIGSHGQTIFHQGRPSRFLGENIASTLQIGEPAVIAAITGVTTVGDFRPADMAVGGQGAPLVPFVDYLLYRDPRRGRAALNIGGIANVTVIPRAASPHSVFAFDTGPGNMAMDALVHHFTHGRRSFDRTRKWPREALLPELVNALLAENYFRQAPPSGGARTIWETLLQNIPTWGGGIARRPKIWCARPLFSPRSRLPTPFIAGCCRPSEKLALTTDRGRRRRSQPANDCAALRRSRRHRSGPCGRARPAGGRQGSLRFRLAGR